MEYRTGYYWQQEKEPCTSLVLQHLVYHREKKPAFFGCICTDENTERKRSWCSSYFAKQLTEWFQMKGRRLCLPDGEEAFEHLSEAFGCAVAAMDAEVAEHGRFLGERTETAMGLAGLLCVGERFLLFYRGGQRGYLLNRRFAKGYCRELCGVETNGLYLLSGIMQPGIGLLLATSGFLEKNGRDKLEECLAISELLQTSNPSGYLRELGEDAARKGARHTGALLLLTDK